VPNFRRYYVPGRMVFITVVTKNRYPYLDSVPALDLYWATLRRVQDLHPFRLLAYVILPNHFHWLMRSEDPQGNFSRILQSFKRNYTRNYKTERGIEGSLRLWQPRFWDHLIRNERDLASHIDYIHYNPVKHEYVAHPEDWAHSTYRHWMERGYYETGWGWDDPPEHLADMSLE